MVVRVIKCPVHGPMEVHQNIKDPVLKECPICKKPVESILQPSLVRFKGEGWTPTFHAKD